MPADPTVAPHLPATGPHSTLPPADPATSELPATGGPPGFELHDRLGEGGMGVVHRARDLALRRDVAVKVLLDRYPPAGPAARRFVEEARITGQLQHPGIPAVYHVGELPGGRPFLAMKLVKGDTLAELLKGNAERGRLVAVFEGVCQAVGYAHAHGVIHRDLKPANVMVGAFGEVQVMDWGLAKVLTAVSREAESAEPSADPEATTANTDIQSLREPSDRTQDGQALGTPAYMAPEQAIGSVADIDRRTDVFGLGAVLCHLLTGKPPYLGADAAGTRALAARAKLADALARLDGCGAEPELVALCKRCLSAEKGDRPADAGAVAAAVADLRRAADDRARAAEVERERAVVRAAEQAKRQRAGRQWMGVVAAVLLAGSGLSGWQTWRARAATGVARSEWANARAAEAEADKRAKDAEASNAFLVRVLVQGSADGQATRERPANPNLTLRAALDHAATAIDGQFAVQPEIEARLRDTVGRAYHGVAAYGAAERHLNAALRLREAALGPGHPATLLSVNNSAELLRSKGDLAAAGPLLRRALAGREQALGPHHPATLASVNNLAGLLFDTGDLAAAEPLLRRAVAGSEAAEGPGHPDTLASVSNLAELLVAKGDWAAAEPLHRRALAGREQALGPHHPATLASASNLALLLRDTGDLAAAEPLLRRALAGHEAAHGSGHPDTLLSVNNLASLLRTKGDLMAAEPLFRRALAGQELALGPDHPDTLASVHNLAALHYAGGDVATAEPLFRRAAEGAERRQFRFPGAEGCVNGYGTCLHALGRHREAEGWQRKGLTAVVARAGAASAAAAGQRVQLGLALLWQGRWAEAETELRQALAVREKLAAAPGSTVVRWQVASAKSLLGDALLGKGDLATADPLLRAGYEGLLADANALPPLARRNLPQAVDRLIRLARATGDAAGLARWQAERAKYPPEPAPPPRPAAGRVECRRPPGEGQPMTATVPAVYAGGVFRPTGPVALADGTPVELTVTPAPPPDELARRVEAVRRLEAFWADLAADAGDDPDDGFDLFEALNRTRLEAGRPPIPPEAWGRES